MRPNADTPTSPCPLCSRETAPHAVYHRRSHRGQIEVRLHCCSHDSHRWKTKTIVDTPAGLAGPDCPETPRKDIEITMAKTPKTAPKAREAPPPADPAPAPTPAPPTATCPGCGKTVTPENVGRVNVGGVGWVRRLYCRCKCGRQFRVDQPLNECGRQFRVDQPLNERCRPALNIQTR